MPAADNAQLRGLSQLEIPAESAIELVTFNRDVEDVNFELGFRGYCVWRLLGRQDAGSSK